ncbi:MAG: ABC transporter ATP-binding protein [Ignavibacteriae bacterium]|nr:ABC transporter ATP-binding protein [Ignavibacteriota bacterium]
MNIYLRILRYVRPYWKYVIISIACTVFYSIFSGISIYLMIPLLETLFNPKTAPPSADGLETTLGVSGIIENVKLAFQSYIMSGTPTEVLLKVSLIIFFAFLLRNLFGYFQSYFMAYAEEGVIKDLRNALYCHLHNLPLGYFTNERTGDLISRVINDVPLVNSGITAGFVTLVREPLLLIVFLFLAFSLSWKLTLLSLVVFPFALLIIGWIALKLHKERGLSQALLGDITSVLQETISGVKVVKAFGMEEFENKKFAKTTWQYFCSLLKIIRTRNLSSPTTEILSVAAGAVIIWYGGTQVLLEQSLNASQFLGFLIIIFQTMPPVKELTSVNNRVQESAAAGKRIFEILDTEPQIKDVTNAIELEEFRSEIEFSDVTFSYDSQLPVLKNIGLKIRKGEVVAIVGPSGSGKSTLVDLIPRFYDPVGGEVRIDGINLKQLKVKSLREKIGIVTQETILFNDTVRNNIAYGLEDCPLEKIIEAAKAANAHNFISDMPQQYNSIIGERGVKISGGERQRLSLARAILKNPPVLILDEATSALDTESEILVQEAIDHLMTGRTSIVIAHRLSTVQHADRIIVLNEGRIVEMGKHNELLENSSGLYKKLYALQFRI